MKRLFLKTVILLLKTVTLLLKLALRMDGWTDGPRPVNYRPNPSLPFWRWRDDRKSIESGDLAYCCEKSLLNKP